MLFSDTVKTGRNVHMYVKTYVLYSILKLYTGCLDFVQH